MLIEPNPEPRRDFLTAVFVQDADIRAEQNGESVLLKDDHSLLHSTDIRVHADCEGLQHFVYRFTTNIDEETFPPFAKATAVLCNGSSRISIYSFERPQDCACPNVQSLKEALQMGAAEAIPLPGVDGWQLLSYDFSAYHNAAQLLDGLLSKDSTTAGDLGPQTVQAAKMYGDADVLVPYNEKDYERPITVTIGAKRDSKQWKPQPMPLAALIGKLCKHEVGDKDGVSLVLADMVPGQRLKKSVRSVTGIGLDIDTGTPTHVVDEGIKALRCLAIRYTTHSHNKTVTEFTKDTVLRYLKEDREIDTEAMQEYCTAKENWDSSIAETVEFIDEDHTAAGIVIRVRHKAMPKHRVIVPLRDPYEINKEGKTQLEAMNKWAKYPAALASLMKVPFDRSCTDPSRLFYLPRHAKGKAFSISLFGGPLFDKSRLQVEAEFDDLVKEVSKKGPASQTAEGRALIPWFRRSAHGFQITEVIHDHASDRSRGPASMGYNIECPFDEDHSTAGDTSDRACFAVNAAEGGNELFIISCRHDACRDKTNLDMLGKMLADKWFDESVLEDRTYNIAEPEEDNAQSYMAAIATLTPTSTDAELERAIDLVLKAVPSAVALERAQNEIHQKAKLNIPTVRKLFKAAQARDVDGVAFGLSGRDGKFQFRYDNAFNFDEAAGACVAVIEDRNMRDGRPTISTMGPQPVRLAIDADGQPRFDDLNGEAMWSELTRSLCFIRRNENGDGARDKVPEDVAKHVFQQSRHLLRQSPTIARAPLFLKDGSLLVTPGYHYDPKDPSYLNHLLLLPDGMVLGEVPEAPTKAHALRSLEWLRTELLNDFPFCDMNDAGKETREPGEAHTLAMIITPFSREMITGRTPVFFVTKPAGGMGGTQCAALPMLISDGRVAAITRYSSNEEEMNKALITSIRSGDTTLFFDDVKEFKSKELLRNITSATISGRVLGTSSRVERRNNVSWTATGCNPLVDDQMDRRIVWIRLNAKTSNVQNRKFRHGGKGSISGMTYDVFVGENRGVAITHVLTLIQYWLVSGSPRFSKRVRVGFEDWCEVVGGILESLDVQGFLMGKSGAIANQERAVDTEFMKAWLAKYGCDNPTSAQDLYSWAHGAGLSIVNGKSEDQKKENFHSDLHRLEGNTFNLPTGGQSKDFTVAATIGDMGVRYLLTPPEQSE